MNPTVAPATLKYGSFTTNPTLYRREYMRAYYREKPLYVTNGERVQCPLCLGHAYRAYNQRKHEQTQRHQRATAPAPPSSPETHPDPNDPEINEMM